MLPRTLVWLLLLVAVVQTIWYYPRLPETVASHFDVAGRPDDCSSKAFFFGLYLVILALVALVFLGFGPLIRRQRGLRLSHPEYWLARERRDETLSFLRLSFLWMGVASLALAVIVF